jgi:hypothetical protein
VQTCSDILFPLLFQVFALGFVSVFDQIMDGFESKEKEAVFSAYINALNEDPAKYRVSPRCFNSSE